MSIGRQRLDDRTAARDGTRIALTHQLGKRLAHRSQIDELALDDLQLAACQFARLCAGVRLLQSKQWRCSGSASAVFGSAT
jgi:hypothetical protein